MVHAGKLGSGRQRCYAGRNHDGDGGGVPASTAMRSFFINCSTVINKEILMRYKASISSGFSWKSLGETYIADIQPLRVGRCARAIIRPHLQWHESYLAVISLIGQNGIIRGRGNDYSATVLQ